MSLPSGDVTFLFTDVEGSTQAWELHPDAMPRAMRRHQEAVRAAVEARDGVVVMDTGDGLFAVFSDAASGLAAAVEAQIGLAGIEWGETGPLRARMGLHAGWAEPVEGDYHGPTVNRCARIMGVAHGARSSCPRPHGSVSTRFRRTSRFSTRDRTGCGSRRPTASTATTRDMSEAVHLHQVLHPLPPSRFPGSPRWQDGCGAAGRRG